MPQKLALAALALALVAVAPPLWAQPVNDVTAARDLFREGAKQAEAGQWEAARDHFARSLRYKRAALTLYNLGIAQQETGHLVDGIESFRAFLALPAEPATQAYVEPVRAVIAQLEARLVEVDLDVRPKGLRGLLLRLDGREVRPAAGPQKLDPGRHEILAVAPGFFDLRLTTSVVEGTRATVAVALVPAAPPPAPRLGLPIALAATGLALFAGGEVAFGVGAHQASTASTTSARNLELAGNVVAGAGALAAGAAVVVLLTRATAKPHAVALAPWSAGGSWGCRARSEGMRRSLTRRACRHLIARCPLRLRTARAPPAPRQS